MKTEVLDNIEKSDRMKTLKYELNESVVVYDDESAGWLNGSLESVEKDEESNEETLIIANLSEVLETEEGEYSMEPGEPVLGEVRMKREHLGTRLVKKEVYS